MTEEAGVSYSSEITAAAPLRYIRLVHRSWKGSPYYDVDHGVQVAPNRFVRLILPTSACRFPLQE